MQGCKIVTLAIAVMACAEPALADCTCRSRDVIASEGQVVCLLTPMGQRLARCDKVLNNSSWTFLQQACPSAAAPTIVRQSLDRLAATGVDRKFPVPAFSKAHSH